MKYVNNIDHKDCVGKLCKSKNSGDFIITKYHDHKHVEVKFLLSGYETVKQLTHIKNGEVRDPYCPSVYGVGITGDKFPIHEKINAKERVFTLQYNTWHSMLTRCYSDKFLLNNPTYNGCSVSENFKHYEYFYEWCNEQVGFKNEGWNLDKDLLIKGNKIYSEDTCVFLPRELNLLLINNGVSRGDLPIGVSYHVRNKKFQANINLNTGRTKSLGYYNTPEEAFYTYKEAKEDFIKEQANKWKDQIDPRAYEALMNYEVDIND